jgi:hypothetical protein
MKGPMNWVEAGFEESGEIRTATFRAAVPGGWLIRVRTLVKTKYGSVAVAESIEYVPGVLEHPIKAKR